MITRNEIVKSTTSQEGKVKWFSNQKGFGYIVDCNGADHHFNVRDVAGADLPGVGDTVEFEVQPGHKRTRAIQVHIVRRASLKEDERTMRCLNEKCAKRIVPRIHYFDGKPVRYCPFCLKEQPLEDDAGWLITIIGTAIGVSFMVAWLIVRAPFSIALYVIRKLRSRS